MNTTKTRVCGIGKRNVFEVVASGGAWRLTICYESVQKESDVFMCSMVGFVTDLGNKVCDDLRSRFVF